MGITPGVTSTLQFNFSDLHDFPSVAGPNTTFAGLLLITNTDAAATGIWSFDNLSIHTVPEPSTLVLLSGLVLPGLLLRRRR